MMINNREKMIKQDLAFTKPLLLTLKGTMETLEKAQSLLKLIINKLESRH